MECEAENQAVLFLRRTITPKTRTARAPATARIIREPAMAYSFPGTEPELSEQTALRGGKLSRLLLPSAQDDEADNNHSQGKRDDANNHA